MEATGSPKNTVIVLLDSLNRHLLGAYGSREFDTPNLDRLAKRSTRFLRHYVGSLPCMPARHDILCGVLDFLWRPWGSIEIWEEALTVPLRRSGVTTMLASDHPHLFEVGGENYHCDFTAWDYQRGHESDPWKTRPDPSWVGAPDFGRGHTAYDDSRGYFRDESDFPGPRTLAGAAAWLEDHASHHERFFLFVDEFDPHEPFDTPEPYASMYDDSWEGPHLIWPPYTKAGFADGILSEREAHQVRASYGGKLTMIDHWLGRILDVMDRQDLWQDTALILCSDHGHYLGEKDCWGKPGVPVYETLGHTPLMISMPGVEPGTCDALTTNVDIHATVLDIFGAESSHRTHGQSMLPLLRGEASQIREYALSGYWGREVHLIDAQTKYVRGPVGKNEPLSMWSNRWSTMPVHRLPDLKLPLPDERAVLDRMPGSNVPVIRQPFFDGDVLPFWGYGSFAGNLLFDLAEDPHEERDLAGTQKEDRAAEQLRTALREIEAPSDQFERLGYGD
ncbi:MAG: sulfatase [bacterium]|nr:sulfatase [bacterium]